MIRAVATVGPAGMGCPGGCAPPAPGMGGPIAATGEAIASWILGGPILGPLVFGDNVKEAFVEGTPLEGRVDTGAGPAGDALDLDPSTVLVLGAGATIVTLFLLSRLLR